jgi:hypothetical protein
LTLLRSGSALALINLDTLQQACERLLQHDPIQGYLVIALAVENATADVVAAKTGIDPVQHIGAARVALAAMALEYESVAFAGHVEEHDLIAAVRAAMRNERRQHGPS